MEESSDRFGNSLRCLANSIACRHINNTRLADCRVFLNLNELCLHYRGLLVRASPAI